MSHAKSTQFNFAKTKNRRWRNEHNSVTNTHTHRHSHKLVGFYLVASIRNAAENEEAKKRISETAYDVRRCTTVCRVQHKCDCTSSSLHIAYNDNWQQHAHNRLRLLHRCSRRLYLRLLFIYLSVFGLSRLAALYVTHLHKSQQQFLGIATMYSPSLSPGHIHCRFWHEKHFRGILVECEIKTETRPSPNHSANVCVCRFDDFRNGFINLL